MTCCVHVLNGVYPVDSCESCTARVRQRDRMPAGIPVDYEDDDDSHLSLRLVTARKRRRDDGRSRATLTVELDTDDSYL
jgi:hypothetical protein